MIDKKKDKSESHTSNVGGVGTIMESNVLGDSHIYDINRWDKHHKKNLSPIEIKKELIKLTGYVTELMKIETENKISNYDPEPSNRKIIPIMGGGGNFTNSRHTNNIENIIDKIEESLNNIPNNLKDLPTEIDRIIKKAKEYVVKYDEANTLAQMYTSKFQKKGDTND